jgi:CBS domain.
LKEDSFLGLLVRMFDDSFELAHRCHEMTVDEAMTKPAVTIREGDGFVEIMESFHRHGGRSMPVVSTDGKLIGLLLRKDFVAAYTLKTAS